MWWSRLTTDESPKVQNNSKDDMITQEMLENTDKCEPVEFNPKATDHLETHCENMADILYQRSDGPPGTINREDLENILLAQFRIGVKVGYSASRDRESDR